MAERVEVRCPNPACGRVYWSAVRGDDTRCPAPGCGRSVYVRLDGTYKGQAPPAAAVGDVPTDVAELGEDQGDVDVEPGPGRGRGGGGDRVAWLWGAAVAGGIVWAWWADRRRRRSPVAAVDVEPVRSSGGFRLPGSPF